MRVYVYRNKQDFSVKALEGNHKGRVLATVEQIMLTDATAKVLQASHGIVGHVEAVYGAQLRDDLDNTTRVGLAINRPWLPFKGSPIHYDSACREFVKTSDSSPVRAARRVKLAEGRAWASGIK